MSMIKENLVPLSIGVSATQNIHAIMEV